MTRRIIEVKRQLLECKRTFMHFVAFHQLNFLHLLYFNSLDSTIGTTKILFSWKTLEMIPGNFCFAVISKKNVLEIPVKQWL